MKNDDDTKPKGLKEHEEEQLQIPLTTGRQIDLLAHVIVKWLDKNKEVMTFDTRKSA